jgi:hypothetical protein
MTRLRILSSAIDSEQLNGNSIGDSEYYVDFVVDDVDINGNVTLVEDVETNARTYQCTLQGLDTMEDNNVAVRHSNLIDPTHQLWGTLATLYRSRNDTTVEQVAQALETNAEALFKTIVESNTR